MTEEIEMDQSSDHTVLKQGAEARIYVGEYKGQKCLVKERFQKKYRHPDLDLHLTRSRIKAEEKAFSRCAKAGVNTPKLLAADVKQRKIYMEYLDRSQTAKQYINEHLLDPLAAGFQEKLKHLTGEIGAAVGKLHANNIIHGDLTTSNILLEPKMEDFSTYRLVMIDFGLSQYSTSVEDKGVDLYVLERALLSTHSRCESLFPLILEAYKEHNPKGWPEVIGKLEEVRARGRKRTMVG